jgi:hypothetical protein
LIIFINSFKAGRTNVLFIYKSDKCCIFSLRSDKCWCVLGSDKYCGRTIGQTSVAQTSVGQTSVGQTSVGQTSVGQTSVGQTSVGQTSVGQKLRHLKFSSKNVKMKLSPWHDSTGPSVSNWRRSDVLANNFRNRQVCTQTEHPYLKITK